MRLRRILLYLLLLVCLPWLFVATALTGSCEYLFGEQSTRPSTPPPPPPGGSDAGAGQVQSRQDRQAQLQADAALNDTAPGELQAISKGLLELEASGSALLIASDVLSFGQTADDRVLCRDIYGRFFSVALDGTDPRQWSSGWDHAAEGWCLSEDEYSLDGNGLLVSPDGKWVAISRLVTTPVPGQDYPARCNAVVICSSAGGDGRCVALAEETDGGPQLAFSKGGSRLNALLYIPGEPTAEHYASLVSSSEADIWQEGLYNYVDLPGGERGLLPGLDNAEFFDRSPLSDNFWYQELDNHATMFSNFAEGGELGRFTPASETDLTIFSEWVLPDALLLALAGPRQLLVRVDGSSADVPAGGYWRCFCSFPDGACLFSRDGGVSIEYGKVDWSSFSVDWSVERPELSALGEPLVRDIEVPEIVHDWQALRDGSGFLVREPTYAGLYVVKVSKEGAKP
ncbi:hypothetical protein IT575_06675 [bacterium]|nr:hypothetical protein [bacterium]